MKTRDRKLFLVPSPASKVADEAEPTLAELEEARSLREALERGDDPFAEALRAAYEPSSLEADDLEAIALRALGEQDAPPTRLEAELAQELASELERGESERGLASRERSDGKRGLASRERSDGERGLASFAIALRAAHHPRALDRDQNDALIAAAFDEAEAAAQLASELESESKSDRGLAALATALRAAYAPTPISAERNEELIIAALDKVARADGARVLRLVPGARSSKLRRILPVTMAALSGAAAIAAGVALFFMQASYSPSSSVAVAPAAFIPARSTAALFEADKPFPTRGEESARIDRIASARASDLRKNRFAAWGVR